MANKHGDFIWYELLTSDVDAAQKFYTGLIDWRVTDSGQSGIDYRILSAKEQDSDACNGVGGMMQINDEMEKNGARPVWLGYIAVDDVDAQVAAITEAGGKLLMPPTDVPDVGRIAMVTDPQAAPFYIMQPSGEGSSLAFAFDKPRPGHCAWNELMTSDQAQALAFYNAQFGWVKEGEMDMGPVGKYEFIRHGGMIGALMTKLPSQPLPMWSFFFRVPDIDVAMAQIKASGGRIVQGPDEIPGGNFALKAYDPQGAKFALVGERKGEAK